jgi:hypothetical protein
MVAAHRNAVARPGKDEGAAAMTLKIGWTRNASTDFHEKAAIRSLNAVDQKRLRAVARETAVADDGGAGNAQVGIQHVRAAFTLWDLGETDDEE